MWKRLGRATIVVLACGLLIGANVHGERKRLKKPTARTFEIRPSELVIVPRLHFGYLIGEAADIMEFYSDNNADKLLVAVATTFEYYFADHWAAQATIERSWKDLPEDAPTITSWWLGAGVQYRLRPFSKRTPFLRAGIDQVWPRASDVDLDSYTSLRLGLGMFEYTSPTTSLRLEILYRTVFAGDTELFGYSCDVQYIGVDFGVGFGL